ncbi:hypothetical protein IK146_03880, partial [Candidatus Saccharibacteria bacterium]|nr:hypothetical protein [Candidatus Saccharibacteria bacterium]
NWSGCSSMQTNQVTALTDTRDGNTYAVAKFADGKCWMMENLRLDLADANTAINASNTNNPTSTFLTERTAVVGTSTPRKGCSSTNAQCIDQISFDNLSVDPLRTPNPDPAQYSSGGSMWLAYGVYYNWYSATAGNGTYSTSMNDSVLGDICPNGWRLPTGNNSSSEAYGLLSLASTVITKWGYFQVETDNYNSFARYPTNEIVYTERSYVRLGMNTKTTGGKIQTSSALSRYYVNSAEGNNIISFVKRYYNHSSSGSMVDQDNIGSAPSYPFKYSTYPVRCLAN